MLPHLYSLKWPCWAPSPQIDWYSSIHQERSYLLSTLAAEESHAQRLLNALETRRGQLELIETKGDSDTQSASNIKKAIGGINRKLKRCYKTQNLLASDLADVDLQLQDTEQQQWGRISQTWNQQAQNSWLNSVQLGMQGLSIRPPISPLFSPYPPATPYLHPHYIPTSPPPISASTQVPVVPYERSYSNDEAPVSPRSGQTPMHNWSWTESPISPLYTPFYASSFDGPYYKSQPTSSPGYFPYSSTPQTADLPPIPLVNESSESVQMKHLRRLQPTRASSAPDVVSKRRESALSPRKEAEELNDEVTQKDALDLGRRLSLVDGTSAGIRLHRKSRN